MAYCSVEKLKIHFPRCEWNSDSTSCDCGRNLRAKLAVAHNSLLEQSLLILTSGLVRSEALSVVFKMTAMPEECRTRGRTLCLVLEVGMYVVARGREQLMSWNEKYYNGV